MLTDGGLEVDRVEPINGADATVASDALGELARLEPDPNPTSQAIAMAGGAPGWKALQLVAFSSARKWSGDCFERHGTWVIGAPDVLITGDEHLATAASFAATGARTVVVGSAVRIDDNTVKEFEPIAFVLLDEPIKADATGTMRFLLDQGVEIKVISGDHPRTVTAVAAAVGVESGRVIDALSFDTDADFLDAARNSHIVGRISPDQKAAVVADLQAHGRTVAMTGDGVNDLLALKQADVGVAMGSASPADRFEAQFVLLADGFGAVPKAVSEGRRVICNVERVDQALCREDGVRRAARNRNRDRTVAVPTSRSPSQSGRLTDNRDPGFFLALEPNDQRARPGFVSRSLTFAIPTGLVAVASTFAVYADLGSDGATIDQSRTAATVVLFVVGMWALVGVARPLTARRGGLVTAMNFGLVAALTLTIGRRFLAFDTPPIGHFPVVVTVAIAALASVELLHHRFALYTRGRALLKRPALVL